MAKVLENFSNFVTARRNELEELRQERDRAQKELEGKTRPHVLQWWRKSERDEYDQLEVTCHDLSAKALVETARMSLYETITSVLERRDFAAAEKYLGDLIHSLQQEAKGQFLGGMLSAGAQQVHALIEFRKAVREEANPTQK